MADAKNIISQQLITITLALSATVAGAHEAPASTNTDSNCRLIVSDKTKSLYPKGLLEFAAQNCWAGPRTDIVVIGQDDVLPQGTHNIRMTPSTMSSAEERLRKLLPVDMYDLMSMARDDNGHNIHYQITAAAARGSSEALNYQFNDMAQPKKVFVAVVDPIHHIHDDLASKAGLYTGSSVNYRFHHEGEFLDRPSMRAMTLAHESAHGAHGHGVAIVENGKINLLNKSVTHAERMRHETEAEVSAYEYYGAAMAAGVNLNKKYLAVDFLMRSLGSYYSGAGDTDRPFAHAVNFGVHPEFTTTSPQQQLEGLKLFRQQLNIATAEAVLNHGNGEIRPEILSTATNGQDETLNSCQAEAVDAAKNLDEDKKWDSYAESMGSCMASNFDTRVFAINGLIEMEKWDGPFRDNKVAKIFARDFKAAVEAHMITSYMMQQAEDVYQKTQRDHIPAPARKYWDNLFANRP